MSKTKLDKAIREVAKLKETPVCHAGSDGECEWLRCPQLLDGPDVALGRHCPLDVWDDER